MLAIGVGQDVIACLEDLTGDGGFELIKGQGTHQHFVWKFGCTERREADFYGEAKSGKMVFRVLTYTGLGSQCPIFHLPVQHVRPRGDITDLNLFRPRVSGHKPFSCFTSLEGPKKNFGQQTQVVNTR